MCIVRIYIFNFKKQRKWRKKAKHKKPKKTSKEKKQSKLRRKESISRKSINKDETCSHPGVDFSGHPHFWKQDFFFLASGQPSAFNSQLVKKVLETFPVKNEDFTKEKFKASIKSQQNN